MLELWRKDVVGAESTELKSGDADGRRELLELALPLPLFGRKNEAGRAKLRYELRGRGFSGLGEARFVAAHTDRGAPLVLAEEPLSDVCDGTIGECLAVPCLERPDVRLEVGVGRTRVAGCRAERVRDGLDQVEIGCFVGELLDVNLHPVRLTG